MKRAVELFALERRSSRSPLVEETWQSRSEPEGFFISVAATHWEMVVTRQRGRTTMTVRGPETHASTVEIPQDADFFGIQFELGAFMPSMPLTELVDGAIELEQTSRRSFWLLGKSWEYPTYDNCDVFIDRLVRSGLLVRDQAVMSALRGDRNGVAARTLQRRIRRATGLSRTAIRLMERANRATDLLDNGATIADVVARERYADQAHLTRSLRRFVGQTPAQIAMEQR